MGLGQQVPTMPHRCPVQHTDHHLKSERTPTKDEIDWDLETAPIDGMSLTPRMRFQRQRSNTRKDGKQEVLLTGAQSFLGRAILEALIDDPNVVRVHCVAVEPDRRERLPVSEKIVVYHGSLAAPCLGLSQADCHSLEFTVTMMIHAGAYGHRFNDYNALRTPNVHSTRFLASLAITHNIPIHYVSSHRVTLLSGSDTLPPVSVGGATPPVDGSEGFLSSKWASERLLENCAAEKGLQACIHRPCALVGDGAPQDDALNSLLTYSRKTKCVPRMDSFGGYLDIRDVDDVASAIVQEALGRTKRSSSQQPKSPKAEFVHHSSNSRVPMYQFALFMEKRYGHPFREVSLNQWMDKASYEGIDPIVATWLHALQARKTVLTFPYMGQKHLSGVFA